jgi:succinate dehydrogenase/fumarate reductase cytochrome b subunit (b558 family)
VLPVGVFMVGHFWTNAKALAGQGSYDGAVADIHHMPYLPVLEAGILVPLAFHALYGVKLALDGRPNVGVYTHSRNWMYTLQRVTGVVALLFILFHLYEYRWQVSQGAMVPSAFYPTLCAHLSSTSGGIPLLALTYVLGVAACSFHFANGLWGFCASWGLAPSRASQRIAGLACGLIGVLVFVLGANTTLYFATGSRFFVPSSPRHDPATQPHSCADLPGPARAVSFFSPPKVTTP